MADAELLVEVDHGQADEGVVTARLAGEVDISTASLLAGELQTAMFTAAPRDLIVDFASVTFMDSTGLRVLITVHQALRERDGVLVIKELSGAPRQLLEVTGLAGHLEIC